MTTPALSPSAKARATERKTAKHMTEYMLFCERIAGSLITPHLQTKLYREAARAHAKFMLAVTAADPAAMRKQKGE